MCIKSYSVTWKSFRLLMAIISRNFKVEVNRIFLSWFFLLSCNDFCFWQVRKILRNTFLLSYQWLHVREINSWNINILLLFCIFLWQKFNKILNRDETNKAPLWVQFIFWILGREYAHVFATIFIVLTNDA